MSSLNSFDFTGRLGRDPELRSTPNGHDVCNLAVAVDRFGDKPALWVDVSVWGNAAKSCAQYLGKGSEVAVHGQIEELRAFTRNNGELGAGLSVSTRDVTFIGGKREDNGSDVRSDFQPSTAAPDDDIPF